MKPIIRLKWLTVIPGVYSKMHHEETVMWKIIATFLIFPSLVIGLNTQRTARTPSYKGFRLEECILEKILVRSWVECAQQCLANEQCQSMNYEAVTEDIQSALCELNNCTKNDNPDRVVEDEKFIYYELHRIQALSMSSIALPTAPRNCSQFLSGNTPSGNYTIYDNTNQSFTVWCHLDHEKGKAWTLVMSLSLHHSQENSLKRVPFGNDAPVNDNAPNLDRYRMSLAKMNYIRTQSTNWYAVCNFDGVVSDRLDTVRGTFSELDPINFIGRKSCKRVKYINIRGHNCSDCTAVWYQDSDEMLHVDSSVSTSCDLQPQSGSVHSENNFGSYGVHSAKFSCTKYDASTTSWWFGD